MDRKYYIPLELDGRDTIWLKRTTPYLAFELLRWFRSTIAEIDKIAEPEDADGRLAAMQQISAINAAAYGRLIGKVVSDAPSVTGDTPEQYGLAVWLAYCEAGWVDEELVALGSACVEAIQPFNAPVRAEVKYRLDFGEAPEE